MGVHNIQYYLSGIERYLKLQEENKLRRQRSYLLDPIAIPFNWLAERMTDALIEPTKRLYHGAGQGAATVAGTFSPSLANRIEESWHDPISVDGIGRLLSFARTASRVNAVRKPISAPFIGFFDQAGIALAQHVYIVSTDLKELLNLKSSIYSFIFNGAQAAKNRVVETLPEKVWTVICDTISQIKELIDWAVSKVFGRIHEHPVAEGALKATKEHVEQAAVGLYSFLANKTNEALKYGETQVRRKVASKVANIVAKNTIRASVKAGLHVLLGRVCYIALDHAFSHLTGLEGFPPEFIATVRKVTFWGGVALWAHFLSPVIIDLNKDYRDDFDPDSNALTELSNLFKRENISPVLGILRDKVKNLSAS